ncbi:class I SAM-dependent methyltransferase [Flavobacterium sp. 25HG05S-40]|uniref:class I SAM-dependent methyltransferase n=1 Tax=Flavobacterium sp. 25HG05S-40 TaxID=3458682 RepID=UPI004043BCE9
MDNYRETFETWNKVAQLYEDTFMDLALYNDTYDTFCELVLPKNPSILEIGCGPGNITKYLLAKRPDFEILGTDIAPNMIALAQKNCPNATFEVLDSRAIEQIQSKFDAIVCGFCIPYLSQWDVEKLIRDCENLLKENGIIYVSFVAGEKYESGYQKGSSGDSTYFYYHTIAEVTHQLSLSNFKNQILMQKRYVKNDQSEEIHSIIIAEK